MWEKFYLYNNDNERFEQVFNGQVTEVIVSGDDLRKLTIALSKYGGINDDGERRWRTILEAKDIINIWRKDLFEQIKELICLLCYGTGDTQEREMFLRICEENEADDE